MKDAPDLPGAVVTGVSGLLGANFAFQAADRFQLSGFFHAHPVGLPRTRCLAVDLADRTACRAALDQLAPAVIFHFAAATNVDWCEDHPEEAGLANAGTTGHLAEWAGQHGALMVYMSTDSVFDGERGGYGETDLPHPINVYGRTKLEGEDAVRRMAPEHLVVRGNMFGWNAQPKASLGEWVLGRLERGERVPGFTDTTFAPLVVNTLADWILASVAAGLRGTWHLGSAGPISKYEFAREIARSFGHDPAQCALDARSLEVRLGRPLPSVSAEVARFKGLRETGFVEALKKSYQP